MALETYEYDKDILIPWRLIEEIEEETSITTALDIILPVENDHTVSPGVNLFITFVDALNSGEKTLLDAIVAAHPTFPEDPDPVAGDGIILEEGETSGTTQLPTVSGKKLSHLMGGDRRIELQPKDGISTLSLGGFVRAFKWSNSGNSVNKRVQGQIILSGIVNLLEDPQLIFEIYTAYYGSNPGVGNVKVNASIKYIKDGESAGKSNDEDLSAIVTMSGNNISRSTGVIDLDKTKIEASDTITVVFKRDHGDGTDTYGGTVAVGEIATLRFRNAIE